MTLIFLSPHFDDAVYSCGGYIYEQSNRGQAVEVWTVCGGEPSRRQPLPPFAESLHQRWGAGQDSVSIRKHEDIVACRRVGALSRHFPLPDCIYRRLPNGDPLINEDFDLFNPQLQPEEHLISEMVATLGRLMPPDAQVISPLAIGNHVDHRLVLAIARGLGREVFFYSDYPYVVPYAGELAQWMEAGLEAIPFEISATGLTAWQDAVGLYASQLSTFWETEAEMREMVARYWAGGGGHLWRLRS